jgi:hypothetical protein
MKYGDQLRQHSVPEWAYCTSWTLNIARIEVVIRQLTDSNTDNVDYDAVKHLIKECTSSGKGKAIDIPGEGEDAKIFGEKRLYNALVSEHERVELFVKSKSNEVQGRLSMSKTAIDRF